MPELPNTLVFNVITEGKDFNCEYPTINATIGIMSFYVSYQPVNMETFSPFLSKMMIGEECYYRTSCTEWTFNGDSLSIVSNNYPAYGDLKLLLDKNTRLIVCNELSKVVQNQQSLARAV